MISTTTQKQIHYWPDGTWCESSELEEYLSWMSDDFSSFRANAELTYEEIDEIVAIKNN